MVTITLKYDPKNQLIKAILDSAVLAGAIVEKTEDSPYNKEFVKKILKSAASKGKVINTEDLWK
jgi:hypothetical protein